MPTDPRHRQQGQRQGVLPAFRLPGGIRATTFKQMQEKHPGRALEGGQGHVAQGPLGYAMVKKLKVYAGATHPHPQQPKLLEI